MESGCKDRSWKKKWAFRGRKEMRIWQKIYLVTLAVFLVMLNSGLFLAASFIFQHNLELEREQARTECYFLSQNLEHDFSILQRNGRYDEEIIAAVIQGYQSYYEKKNSAIALRETEGEVADEIQSTVEKGGSRIYVRVQQVLSAPYEGYFLFYEKELKELEDLWQTMKRTFVLISLVMSLTLCLILYFLMQRILRPLDSLNAGVAEIAAGHYEREIFCQGKDEIAELAANVNRMSEEIRKQIAALKEKNGKKQQLMDNMAHELRTPLTSIYGYAEYLQRAKVSEKETYEGLSYIMSESRRLTRMGEMMLSMRMYEQEEICFEPVSVKQTAVHVEKLLRGKLQEKQMKLECNFSVEYVMGEEVMLVNLFRNLLENAIRASKVGGSIFWIGYHKNGVKVFEMIDEGIGMDAEELNRIMEPFYRVDKARSRENGGAGLGLSVAGMIVERHGGRMEFASEKDVGTKVTVTFPGNVSDMTADE